MADELGLDARAVLADLTRLLKAQEGATKSLASTKKKLQDDIETMERRATLAEANAASLETERARLVDRESVLRREVENLTKELSVKVDSLRAELVATTERLTRQAQVAEERARVLRQERDAFQQRAEYGDRMKPISERVDAAEERAAMFEERCNALQVKADRHDALDRAASKLLEELDRLPLSMDEAGIIPGEHRPKIELYGTYDWQNVMDAKFALKQAMRKEDS